MRPVLVPSTPEPEHLLHAFLDRSEVGMALLAADGEFLRVNDALCELLGRAPEELIGRTRDAFTHPGDRSAVSAALTSDVVESVQSGTRFLRPDGGTVWVIVTTTAAGDGDSPRWIGQFQDVTGFHESRDALRRQSELLSSVIDNAPIGKALVAPDGTFIRVNRSLCRILGYEEDELVGLTFQEITVQSDLPEDLANVQLLLAGEIDDYQMEKRYRHKVGHPVWIRLTVSLLRDLDGEPLHFIAQIEDISRQKLAEEELRQANDRAEAILTAMDEGYALTVDGAITAVNDRLCEITGFRREELVGATSPFPFWPTDLHEETAAIRERVIAAHGGTFEMTFMRADGTRFDGEVTAHPGYHADGSFMGFVNTIRDVTDRKRHAAEAQALAEIAELVASNAGSAAVFAAVARSVQHLFGAHCGLVTRFNRVQGTGSILSSFGVDGHTLNGRVFDLNADTAAATVFRTGRSARLDTLQDVRLADYFTEHKVTGAVAAPIAGTGQLWGALVASYSGQAIPRDAEERLERFGRLVTLAVANAQAWATLERDARTDALTGLLNHRAFNELVAEEVTYATNDRHPLSLILFDLDHFKRVNDTHGHQVGDEVLARIGALLDRHARDSDVTARIGGEEFAWLMPHTTAADATHIAERMRRVVSEHIFGAAGRLTISAGIGSFVPPMAAPELVLHADRALYQAKNTGRDTVRSYTGAQFLLSSTASRT